MLKNLRLPQGLEKYRETSQFSFDSTPKGFLKNHSTKQGVWGRLVVHQGQVQYQDAESGEKRYVKSGEYQVIQPQLVHFIEPSLDAEFLVEFHKAVEILTNETHQGNPDIPSNEVSKLTA